MYRSVRGHGSNLLKCEIHISSLRAVMPYLKEAYRFAQREQHGKL
jgi:hypothetical protein